MIITNIKKKRDGCREEQTEPAPGAGDCEVRRCRDDADGRHTLCAVVLGGGSCVLPLDVVRLCGGDGGVSEQAVCAVPGASGVRVVHSWHSGGDEPGGKSGVDGE